MPYNKTLQPLALPRNKLLHKILPTVEQWGFDIYGVGLLGSMALAYQAMGIYWRKGKKEGGEEGAPGRWLGKGSLVSCLEWAGGG